MRCPHCERTMFRASPDKLKLRTMLVLHKGGEVEVNCEHCKRGVILPLRVIDNAPLKKATQRFVILDKDGTGTS